VTRGGEEFRLLSLPEAIDRLRSPYAQEEFASLTGDGVLVVDLPAGEGALPPAREIDAACRGLAQLACPTVGLVPGELSPTVAEVAGAFDVILPGGASELAVILSRVRAQPRASLSLVYSTLQAGPEFTGWLAGRTRGKRDASTAPAVRVERKGSTLRLTLNRPERHNAFGLALRDGLVEGLQLALSDDSVKEVVLAGAGPSFSSGGDLDEFGTFPDPATAHAVRSIRNPGRLLAQLAQRGRAEVHGACIGAGAELPAFLARVTAAPDAYFQLPEVGMGLVPGAGGSVSLPRRIGRQRTARLALGGERIDAETALAWGLVDEIREGDPRPVSG
jgi:enoyl-CoA hydratase/carnithine racemase